ncbi:hypothetical protein BXY66_3048 [Shimia isoporae]|uniref:Uncharacterized protein n=1 Tax=Shimia isoporae TaxID=647720 RepID=A0A4R1N6L8_9RHOB|nr:hypothetical protein [Shimia isoporae]TCL00407.1 hypothetical protein BXY66_3048 [Shimia isoporae]
MTPVTTPFTASLSSFLLMSRMVERQMRTNHAMTRAALAFLTPYAPSEPTAVASVGKSKSPKKTVSKAAPKAAVGKNKSKPTVKPEELVFKSVAPKTTGRNPEEKPKSVARKAPPAKSAPEIVAKTTDAPKVTTVEPVTRKRTRQPSKPPAMPKAKKTTKAKKPS